MQPKPNISYAVCVKEEVESFRCLINFLNIHKKPGDEIVVISDFTLSEEINEYKSFVDTFVFKKLLYDFASHKNVFFSLCKNEYIFNIDADELPSVKLINDVHNIISSRNIDLIWIPRLNFYIDDTTSKVKKNKAINFPDYQGRIYKNNNKLRWKNKLHEQIKGAKQIKKLEYSDEYYLTHTKTTDKQIASDKLYTNLVNYCPDINSLGIVCCYFNPCNYRSKFLNFTKFLNGMRSIGIDPLIIETYSYNSLFRVNNLSNNVISLKTNSIFWKKEQLLNIGIKELLKDDFTYIAWLDADILFRETDWWKQVILATKFYGIVQVFSNSYKETVKTNYQNTSTAYLLNHIDSNQDLETILKRKSEPGYGHCYHRSYLEENLLYDLSIIGGGDLLNLIGYYYNENTHDKIMGDRFFKDTTNAFKKSFTDWCKRNKKLKHGVGYANVNITSLYHGSKLERRYESRENILKKYKFNPYIDLKIKDNIYEIQKPELKKIIVEHFYSRNEDSLLRAGDMQSIHKINSSIQSNNLEFIQNTIYDLYKENKKNKLSDFVIDSTDKCLVAVRSTESLFSIKRVKIKTKILIDGNVSPCLNSFTQIKNLNTFGIFLRFIYEFYSELPKTIYFTHNLVDRDICSGLNDSFNTIPNEFVPIIGKIKMINMDQHKKIKNYVSLRSWYKEVLNKTYNESSKMFIGSCFAIPKQKIHRKKRSFFKSILDRYKSNPEKEEHILRVVFYDILK